MIKILSLVGILLLSKVDIEQIASIQQKSSCDTSTTVFYDFGIISKDVPVAKIFRIYNNTDKSIRIRTIGSSIYCTVPAWTKKPIPPGKFGLMKVSYNGELIGPFEANLKVLYYGRENMKSENFLNISLI
ncbi:DUF1573 domain-containing protein [Rubrolithibacter danxiaensis]|uniref:DUF1573 domain-containing protein n=1 Tax=Rubrolithibacter danxiaensis TaxID=3390805 RepID=UPI003BF903D4